MRKAALLSSAVAMLISVQVLAAERPDQTAAQIAAIRAVTAKYHDVEKAKADGYQQVSLMVPNMGHHFRNQDVKGFELERPHILLYVKAKDDAWQLVGVEWGFPKGSRPPDDQIPFKKPQWSVHKAACHFKDYSEISMTDKDKCPAKSPETGAEVAFWHPDLDTLHVWAWHPSPRGPFTALNPLLAPYNPPAPQKSQKR